MARNPQGTEFLQTRVGRHSVGVISETLRLNSSKKESARPYLAPDSANPGEEGTLDIHNNSMRD